MSGKKILIVEDENVTARAVSALLEKNGYSVETACTGEEAVDRAGASEFDLVLMDIDLGEGIDGTEAARRILTVCNIPVVFHTNHSEKEMVERVKGISRYGYVLKNAGQFVLIESISMAMELFEAHVNKETLLKLKKKTDFNDALLKAAKFILKSEDFVSSARHVFDASCFLTGATAGYVALLNEDGDENELLFLEAGGRECTVDPELPMPIRGLREVAYRTREAVYDNDFMNSRWMDYMPEGHVRLDNVLFAPLNLGNKTVGIIGIANKPAGFTDEDSVIAEAFGDLAAIALYNSRTLGRLKESDDVLNRAQKMAHVGSWEMDIETGASRWSDEFFRICGFEPRAFIPTKENGFEIIHPDDRERAAEELAKAIDEQRPYSIEKRVVRPDGEVRHVKSIGEIECDEKGSPVRLVGTFLDTTEVTMNEKKIMDLLKEKDILLTEVHHRIKNDMNSIGGMLSLQSLSSENPEVINALEEAQNRIQTMGVIYESLYRGDDISRINLKSFIGPLLMNMAVYLERKNVIVQKDVADFDVSSDIALPIGIIFNELLTNSLKYAFSGSGQGRVSLAIKVENDDQILFSYSDNGPGIPGSVIKEKKFGLGLLLVHEYVKQLKGNIEIDGRDGTLVSIKVPLGGNKKAASGQ